MADVKPSKDDIETIFRKLRAMPTNKVCFDCNAKNPTWATVTYGVFICIDCSAVHRSLGVHLTFVRSTQLDTNWTWPQLRQMQLGGNATASVFFRQHNCVTTDAQQKYTSRAAQLYREKLAHLATSAIAIHGTELHLEPSNDKPDESKKEIDFFDEHSSFPNFRINEASDDFDYSKPKPPTVAVVSSEETASAAQSLNIKGPSVDLNAPAAPVGERKSIIGGRKPAAKKTGMGGRKAGLGAQRVQTNFADVEKQAEMIDQRKEKQVETKIVTEEDEQEQMVSMRLAYQDLKVEQQRQEDRIKRSDPKKAQQVERLGMGFAAKSGFSHSALSDMKTIDQESPVKKSSGKSTYDAEDADDFFDDFSFPPSLLNHSSKFQDRNSGNLGFDHGPNTLDELRSMVYSSNRHGSMADSGNSVERERFGSREDKPTGMSSSKSWYGEESRSRRDPAPTSGPITDDAQKKFGNAKAISSDQFFGQSNDNNYERKANLSRFEGSTSISSSDYFQDGRGGGSGGSRPNYGQGITSSISAPDLDDVKESVRQGVTKVAGRISSLANGVINSIQDRYGY